MSTTGAYADDDARQNKEILASLRTSNTIGMWVKFYGLPVFF